MANATIQSYPQVQTGNFTVVISFFEEVSGFALSNISSSVGTVTVSSLNTLANNSYSVVVSLPSESSGSFTLSLIGTVSVDGTTESIVASDVTYRYDTKTSVTLTAGAIEYTANGDYMLNFTSGEAIAFVDKTDFSITRVSGDEIFDMEYGLIQSDTAGRSFFLIFIPEDDRAGEFKVQSTGHALLGDGIRVDQISGINKNLKYNNVKPKLVRYSVPTLTAGVWDIYFEFNIKILDLALSDFVVEGANLSSPKIYRNPSNTGNILSSSFRASVPSSVSSTADLASSVGSWNSADVSFVDGNGVMLQSTPSKFFLFRYVVTENQLTGKSFYNLVLRPNSIRGDYT